MKNARLLFVLMMAAIALPGKSLAVQSDSVPKPAASASTEKSLSQQADGEARSGAPDKNPEQPAERLRTKSRNRPSTTHAKLVPSPQARPARRPLNESRQLGMVSTVVMPHQTGLKGVSSVSGKAASYHFASVPASSLAVNGKQFRNSRDPGARLAVSGGPLATLKGTAAINGTTMKRKP